MTPSTVDALQCLGNVEGLPRGLTHNPRNALPQTQGIASSLFPGPSHCSRESSAGTTSSQVSMASSCRLLSNPSGRTHTQAEPSSSRAVPHTRARVTKHILAVGVQVPMLLPGRSSSCSTPLSSGFPSAEPGTRFHSSPNVPALLATQLCPRAGQDALLPPELVHTHHSTSCQRANGEEKAFAATAIVPNPWF